MASSAQFGVVDSNCKVFGTENLYVAGSSIFATGGASNPTMPLLQFAVRLADHLDAGMSSAGTPWRDAGCTWVECAAVSTHKNETGCASGTVQIALIARRAA